MINMQSKRIKTILSLLDACDNIIDIGCDHAYVAILMAYHGSKKILATDIHKGALEIAKDNIKKEGLENIIQTKLTDGLVGIDTKDYNTLVIAGMGASTIISILSLKEKLKSIKKIIIQSNNDLDILRKYMESINYKINKEIVVYEKGHYYTIIEYICGKDTLKPYEYLYGKYNKDNKEYYEYINKKLDYLLDKVPRDKNKELKLKKEYLSYYL